MRSVRKRARPNEAVNLLNGRTGHGWQILGTTFPGPLGRSENTPEKVCDVRTGVVALMERIEQAKESGGVWELPLDYDCGENALDEADCL